MERTSCEGCNHLDATRKCNLQIEGTYAATAMCLASFRCHYASNLYDVSKPDNRTKYRHAPITRADGTVDHYCYMQMIGMDNSAIDHAIKKLTHAGKRGEKSKVQDWKESIMSIESAIEIEENKK